MLRNGAFSDVTSLKLPAGFPDLPRGTRFPESTKDIFSVFLLSRND